MVTAPESRNPVALTIAGSDSGAGAGIQADLKTFAAHGVYGISVLTLITAQSTQTVDALKILPPELIIQQLQTVFADFEIAALKSGALGSVEVIRAVAGFLAAQQAANLVIDPVMISKHGHRLISEDAIAVLIRDLLPLARVVTPNLSEAAALSKMHDLGTRDAVVAAAAAIAALGCRAVVIKGGHSEGEPADLLWNDGVISWLEGPRISTPHTHGTGCTFSAAIAANLVKGLDLADAVRAAKRYTAGAIRHGQIFGRGINPVNHFWQDQPDFGTINR